ncbi:MULTISPECIES: hypothetical protein [unclassified Blastococcus]
MSTHGHWSQEPGYEGPPAYGPPPGPPAVPPYGYGQPPYGPPAPYPPAPYPPSPYPPGYGPAWPGAAPPTWPHGPGRPGVATAAAVLGFVTGGLTLLGSLGFLIAVLTGEDDAATVVLVLGLPCAAGMIAGAVRLLARRSPTLLFGSALAAVAVLLVALLVGAGSFDDDAVVGIASFVLLAGALPVLTAVFARLPATLGWVGSAPPS